MWCVLQWFHSSDTASSDTLLSIVLCTVLPLSSQRNWRSLCMTQHYILQGERRWKKMKWDSSGTSTKNTASSMSVALPRSERWIVSLGLFFLSVWHSTLQGYWLHCNVMSLPEHQLGAPETRKQVYIFIYVICLNVIIAYLSDILVLNLTTTHPLNYPPLYFLTFLLCVSLPTLVCPWFWLYSLLG